MSTAAQDQPAARADALRAAGDRIEALIEASAAGGPASRTRAEDLVSCVSSLYGAGLGRLLEVIDDAGHLDQPVLDAIADDELLSGLLLVHDLHPYDVETRIARALDTVRPYLGTHGGDVELLGIDSEGVVRLRLLGSCDGCPSSSATLELAVEGAVQAAAPEMTRIEVAASAAKASPVGGVIGIDALRSRIDRQPAASVNWLVIPELADLVSGQLAGFELDGLTICACRLGNDIFCFRDRCGHCAQSLAGSAIERRLGEPIGSGVLRCAQCRAHFDLRHAGAGLDGPEEHLEPLPVLVRDGILSVALPSAAVS
ncbi:MAG: NifU family protein [Actinomycetota bacterium]|nr:NifU family protein [Actinomycetota bacterium]MDQ2847127.1 NifU family protein [Actinomycetota bacterium]MDQ2955709.1 NifU family protein [Actinomycetota bacterium]